MGLVNPERMIRWREHIPPGINSIISATAEECVRVQRLRAAEHNHTYISDQSALDDFMSVNWAWYEDQHMNDSNDTEVLPSPVIDDPNPGRLIFSAMHPEARIPEKRLEDAGYDLYTVEEDSVAMSPGEIRVFRTGIRSRIPEGYFVSFRERGSTGKIGLSVRAGVVDAGYRGEWLVLLNNTSKVPIIISTREDYEDARRTVDLDPRHIWYDIRKAIAQAIMLPVCVGTLASPKIVDAATYDATYLHDSKRGEGRLGSSGK